MVITIGFTHISNALHLLLYHILSFYVSSNFLFSKKIHRTHSNGYGVFFSGIFFRL